jgi:hypothetical protein
MDVTGRLGSGAGDFDEIAGGGAEDSLGEMAPAGVAGAKDEDEWFHGSWELAARRWELGAR